MTRLRTSAAAICSVVLAVASWRLAELPASSDAERAHVAERFAFQREPLNGAAGARSVRVVAPAFQKIDHWISSVGAGVALADLDGNGRADDACLVDPRDDSVTLRPVPGTGTRYPVAALAPAGLPYDATMAPMGCVPSDYNEDGRTDVLVYYWGRSPVVFLRSGAGAQVSAGAFTPRELVSPYQVWSTNALTLADVDTDGHVDIVVGNYFPDRARVLDPRAHQQELRMQRSMSDAHNGGTDRVLLFRSAGGDTVSYAEAKGAFAPEVADGWTLALGAQDLDGDGRPELYMGNDFGPDRLLRNLSTPGKVRLELMRGVRHFGTPKSKVVGADSFKGMGVVFSDLNGDEVPDMFVSNITENYALHESNFAFLSTRQKPLGDDGVAHYDDESESLGVSRSGWGWDVKAGDFAGDGDVQLVQATGFIQGTVDRWPQLQELALTNDDLLANPANWPRLRPGDDLSGHDTNPFWARGADGRFHDVAERLGVEDPGPTRSIALADVDHDGRLDFAVANQWRQSYSYRNVRTAQRPYLGLTLLRPASCAAGGTAGGAARTAAVGATATLRSGAAGLRVGQVYPANGHGGVSSPELLFGLSGTGAAAVTLTWRDACGARHSADTTLTPGWHSLALGADGSIEKVTP
ncbi:VCBS repeat-containing protein [Sphaerisporangium sp. TRM90804]|uniref:FG-GAP repeat domain-containing protein n=1 Tax=Sphaerisporangium sp. TRM90804 TaxID=3031113 RepID=UPI00244706AA|nr:VCBS repeat-containing protein [Sphaerisporangium sp. TRM90804]MDH2429180.1 VCBS repeat-containing protein [Sphaerisporangium sp. TRM90804]